MTRDLNIIINKHSKHLLYICVQTFPDKIISFANRTSLYAIAEFKEDGEPKSQVPEEGLKSEEGWHEIFNILLNCFMIYH